MSTELASLYRSSEGGSLVQSAMQAVTAYIKDNQMRVGDTLPGEAHFAEKLDVSRAVMREAFGALSALRLISVANGRKPRVAALDGAVIAASLQHAVSTAQIAVADVWDVRRTIEQRTAALAAASRTPEEAQTLLDLAAAMERDYENQPLLTQHDIDFHNTIARASHNALFIQIVASFAPLMEVAVPTAWRTRVASAQKKLMLDRHRAIAQAIADGDPKRAAAAMEAHFDDAIGDLLKAEAQNPDRDDR